MTHDDESEQITLDEAIARLDDSYELVYVSYDDKLNDEQVNHLIRGDMSEFWDSLAQFEGESRYHGARNAIYDKFSREEWDSLSDDDQETVLLAIEERDNSDFVTPLIEQTPNPLLRICVVDEDNAWSFEPVEASDVLSKIGFEATEHNLKVVEAALLECSPEYSVLLAYWVCSVDLKAIYEASEDASFKITNPYLFLGNPVMGSGWLTEKPLEGSCIVDRSELTTDEGGFGYSLSKVYGGLRNKDFQSEIEVFNSEVSVTLPNGWTLRSGSSSNHISGEWVRLCKPDGTEHTYWDHAEWRDDPIAVMGAIVNAAAVLPLGDGEAVA